MAVVVVRATLVDETVLNTAWDIFDASLKTPEIATVKSARSSNRSLADLSSPVMSCSSLGVAMSIEVMSFEIVRADPPESSMMTLIPKPDSLAIVYTPPVHMVVVVVHKVQRLKYPRVLGHYRVTF